ncbi:hypothetical protein HY622_03050 [Candidatus Uhrbacteria bacterium]|nr:hypothetical protein [Candidatus Uhrbacteria bacterium]
MRFAIFLLTLFLFLSSVLPADAQQKYDYDVAATIGSISFVPPQIKAGEPLRIYGTIVNVGNNDLTGYVGFYQGTLMIGEPQLFSLKANGVPEEIWVDWVPPEGTYNIMMTVLQTKPDDQNPSNNVSLTPMLTVRKPLPPVVPMPEPSSPAVSSSAPATPSGSAPKIKDEPVAVPSTTIQKPAILQESKPKTVVLPSAPIIKTKPKATKDITTLDVQAEATSSTSTTATGTSIVAPLFAQYSEEFKKVAVQQSERIGDEVSTSEPEVTDKTFVEEENVSNRFLMIGSSVAVAFLLVGLIFLKRSGIV